MSAAPAAVVFVGPSLSGRPVAPPPGVVLAPPAEAGDLYRAARAGVRVIGLVDGTFGDRPTVWHKEILWALDRGVRVLGAASIGALRAAECAAFGMEGIGAIYAAAADGRLEDDHAVALVHAPAELDYAPVSEPLVNVRATLDAATAAGVLSAAEAEAVATRAEALPYAEVTWRALAAALPDPAAFAAWLPGGRVDLKRADALALLEAVAAAVAAPAPAAAPGFAFADSRYWRAAAALFERGAAALSPADGAVLDELRLEPARYERALVRALAARAAPEADDADEDPGAALDDLRQTLGLGTADAFRAWCAAARTTPDRLVAALAAEDRLLRALEAEGPALAPAVLDALRAGGRFARLEGRAADKAALLADRPDPVFREADLPALVAALCARARVSIDSDDPDVAARALGLADRRALHRLLAREEAYLAARGTG